VVTEVLLTTANANHLLHFIHTQKQITGSFYMSCGYESAMGCEKSDALMLHIIRFTLNATSKCDQVNSE